jgi:hypothetical protein
MPRLHLVKTIVDIILGNVARHAFRSERMRRMVLTTIVEDGEARILLGETPEIKGPLLRRYRTDLVEEAMRMLRDAR